MENEVTYFPNAKWVELKGEFTVEELEEIVEELKARG